MEIKLPIYDWVVRFLNGVLSVVLLAVVDADFFVAVLKTEVVKEFLSKPELVLLSVSFAIAYELGYIVDRLGSLMESIFKRIKAIPFNDDYALYNKAKADYPIMSTLQKGYAVSRTQFALFAVFSVVAAILHQWAFMCSLIFHSGVQYFSWAKFAKKIVKLMISKK